MNSEDAHELGGASLVIRPNRSLPIAGILALFVALSALALTVGVGFALAGAWMVLPFAIVEVAIVGALCRWFYRHLDDCELVTVEPDRVRVMKRRGSRVAHYEFSRHWVRVVLDGGDGSARLRIGSHGRLVSLADDVNEQDRALVARELRRLLAA